MRDALFFHPAVACFGLLSSTVAVTFDRTGHVEDPSANQNDEFEQYLSKHGRSYQKDGEEYVLRRNLFMMRAEKVKMHNANPAALWVAGLNAFSDRTKEERDAMKGWRGPSFERRSLSRNAIAFSGHVKNTSLPASFDWKHLNTSKKMKDQGSCGSCWAFSTVTMMEAQFEIHAKKTVVFSPQELVSCVANPNKCGGEGGCKGATVELGMQYIMENGLSTEDRIPYQASDMSCAEAKQTTKTTTDIMYVLLRDDPTKVGMPLSGVAGAGGQRLGLSRWETLPTNKEDPLVRALVERGPVAVSVAADAWMDYQSGIFDACPRDCVVDHAVVLYGYGTDGNSSYWLIRNSWGENWGEQGYIRMLRRDDEESWCGVDNDPAKGLACEGGPSTITVCGTCGVLYDSVVPYFAASDNESLAEASAAHVAEPRLMRREQ